MSRKDGCAQCNAERSWPLTEDLYPLCPDCRAENAEKEAKRDALEREDGHSLPCAIHMAFLEAACSCDLAVAARDEALNEATHCAAEPLEKFLGRELSSEARYRLNDLLTVFLAEES